MVVLKWLRPFCCGSCWGLVCSAAAWLQRHDHPELGLANPFFAVIRKMYLSFRCSVDPCFGCLVWLAANVRQPQCRLCWGTRFPGAKPTDMELRAHTGHLFFFLSSTPSTLSRLWDCHGGVFVGLCLPWGVHISKAMVFSSGSLL